MQVKAMICDQSSLKSVRQFASEFKKLKSPLHLLVLNAGVMKSPGSQFTGINTTYGFELTEDGFEQHIGVNHIAHFYMTQLLTKQLTAGAPSRVVAVSSSAHSGGYPEGIRPDSWSPSAEAGTPDWYEDGNSYAQSKLANILFAREFSKRMKKIGVAAYAVHPGVVKSDLGRYMLPEFAEDLKEKTIVDKCVSALLGFVFIQSNMVVTIGSLTQLYVATAPEAELTPGGFYWPIGKLTDPDHPSLTGPESNNEKLWTETEKAISRALRAERREDEVKA